MGSYLFRWTHPASEVYVTGTFDDWGKTVKLDKKGDAFEKLVTLPKTDEKVFYKFVVDDNWTTDHTVPQETDAANNTNNVLLPENIMKGSTTEANQDAGSSALPGAFPETPAAENTQFSVNPIPASAGIGNPVSARPGAPVPPPSTFTNKSVNDNVTLNKESYEKSGTVGAPQLPGVVTPDEEREANGGMFGLSESSNTVIPESSLPMGAAVGAAVAEAADSGPTIQSVGSQSTTAGLAGQVPIEPRGVPEVVEKSQAKAEAPPEASANPTAVQEKAEVEKELTKTIPEEPPTSESTISGKTAGLAAGAVAGVTGAAAGAVAYVSSGKATEDAKAQLPVPAKETLDKVNGGANGAPQNGAPKDTTPIAATVPDVVQESISEAHQAPEAAANEEAVKEKSKVETELLKKVEPEQGSGAPAPTISAATTETAPAPLKSTEEPLSESKPVTTEKDATETTSTPAVATGLAAPAAAPAMTAVTEAASKARIDSRDVSPMSHPVSQPTITTGVGSAETPKKSTAAASTSSSTAGSPASAKTGESSTGDKKKNRRSFFGKLKDKLEHRKDKA